MDADDFMRNYSWSHEIVEVHPHGAPEISHVQSLESSELLVPQVDLAVQALNAVVREHEILAFMHKLRCGEVCYHVLGSATKHFLACLDVRRQTISYQNIWWLFCSLLGKLKHSACSSYVSLLRDMHSNHAILVINHNPEIGKVLAAFHSDKLLIDMPDVRKAHASAHTFQEKGKFLHPEIHTDMTWSKVQRFLDEKNAVSCAHERSIEDGLGNNLLWIPHPAEEAEASF